VGTPEARWGLFGVEAIGEANVGVTHRHNALFVAARYRPEKQRRSSSVMLGSRVVVACARRASGSSVSGA